VAWIAGTALLLVFPGGWAGADVVPGPGQSRPLEPRPDEDDGRRLFQRDCVVCHGPLGEGTNRGPGITDEGAAGVDFVLRTGRMPLSNPDEPMRRRAAKYTDDEIAAIVDHARTFVEGPEVPEVAVDPQTVARGGELFRRHCAACHQMVGTGGVLVGERPSPALLRADPTEVVEALRYGPGTMPRFSPETLSDAEATAVATYVAEVIRSPRDAGGFSLGHFGPWTEGADADEPGDGALLAVSGWIGRRT
jgi:ubiquinol-cytochrome c reductase cytochrome c subunit